MKAAVFLDRDNTIIHNDGDLGDPDKVSLIQGAASAIASLRGLGYTIVVVTNQGGVARGKYGLEDVNKVHARIQELVHTHAGTKIDRFYFCPYHPQGTVAKYKREHPWRKPQPGMMLQAAKDMQLDLGQSWLIGDQLRDIEAGIRAGVRTILLKPDAQPLPPLKVGKQVGQADSDQIQPDFATETLIQATRVIAQQRRPEGLTESWSETEKTVKHRGTSSSGLAGAKKEVSSQQKPPRPFRPWNAPAQPEDISANAAARASVSMSQKKAARDTATPASAHSPGGSPGSSPGSSPKGAPIGTTSKDASRPGHSDSGKVDKTLFEVAPGDATAPKTPNAAAMQTADQVAALPARPVASSETSSDQTNGASEPPVEDAADQTTVALEVSGVSKSQPLSPGETDAGQGMLASPLLRQILQELRLLRSHRTEFSYLKMFATILQMVAGVCLLTSLWLGDKDLSIFFHWIGTTVVVQLAVIAMLLFDRH